ncbi:hypothetical protein G6L37_00155 [Agrobacterium rubi]|nr:hypothetical protein [Agrobacterium rubi]NTF23662.1 hypothetical protein [Agrobacterium rubi]
MHQRIRNIDSLKSFFQKFIVEHASMLEKMDEARANDTLRHFMSWNAPHLHVMTVYANESARFMKFLTEDNGHDDDSMNDDRKFELVSEEVERRVLNLNMRITSRSSGIGANLDEDAERAFWIELYQALRAGY